MSSVVRKVRDMFGGSHRESDGKSSRHNDNEGESNGEGRKSLGKVQMTDHEREKLISAGYTDDGSDKRGLAGHGATGTFEALNPNTTTVEHPNAIGNQSDYEDSSPSHKFDVTDSERDRLKSLGYTDEGMDRRGIAGAGVTGTREALQDTPTAYDQQQQQQKRLSSLSSRNTRPTSKHEGYAAQYDRGREYGSPRHSHIDTYQASNPGISEADIHPAFRNTTRSYREVTTQELYERPERRSYVQNGSSATGTNARYADERQQQVSHSVNSVPQGNINDSPLQSGLNQEGIYNAVVGAGARRKTEDESTSLSNQPTFKPHPGVVVPKQGVAPRNAGNPEILATSNNTAAITTTAAATAASSDKKDTTTDHRSPSQSPRVYRDLERKPGYESLQNHSQSTTAQAYKQPQPQAQNQARSSAGTTTTLSNEDSSSFATAAPRVVHRCTKCGEDNDISHYFHKGAVYRADR